MAPKALLDAAYLENLEHLFKSNNVVIEITEVYMFIYLVVVQNPALNICVWKKKSQAE